MLQYELEMGAKQPSFQFEHCTRTADEGASEVRPKLDRQLAFVFFLAIRATAARTGVAQLDRAMDTPNPGHANGWKRLPRSAPAAVRLLAQNPMDM
jgi:hypothetical protein